MGCKCYTASGCCADEGGEGDEGGAGSEGSVGGAGGAGGAGGEGDEGSEGSEGGAGGAGVAGGAGGLGGESGEDSDGESVHLAKTRWRACRRRLRSALPPHWRRPARPRWTTSKLLSTTPRPRR